MPALRHRVALFPCPPLSAPSLELRVALAVCEARKATDGRIVTREVAQTLPLVRDAASVRGDGPVRHVVPVALPRARHVIGRPEVRAALAALCRTWGQRSSGWRSGAPGLGANTSLYENVTLRATDATADGTPVRAGAGPLTYPLPMMYRPGVDHSSIILPPRPLCSRHHSAPRTVLLLGPFCGRGSKMRKICFLGCSWGHFAAEPRK